MSEQPEPRAPKNIGVKITPEQWREMKDAADNQGTTIATKLRELGLQWARTVNAEGAQ